MVEKAKFLYMSRKRDTEISLFLGERPKLIFRLRGTRPPRPPAFDAHESYRAICSFSGTGMAFVLSPSYFIFCAILERTFRNTVCIHECVINET